MRFLIFVLLIFLVGCGGQPKIRDFDPPISFKYKHTNYSGDKYEYYRIHIHGNEITGILEKLNSYGEQGWILSCVAEDSGVARYVAIFYRRKNE